MMEVVEMWNVWCTKQNRLLSSLWLQKDQTNCPRTPITHGTRLYWSGPWDSLQLRWRNSPKLSWSHSTFQLIPWATPFTSSNHSLQSILEDLNAVHQQEWHNLRIKSTSLPKCWSTSYLCLEAMDFDLIGWIFDPEHYYVWDSLIHLQKFLLWCNYMMSIHQTLWRERMKCNQFFSVGSLGGTRSS